LPDQLNTTEREIYGGIITSVGKHFNLSCKASYLSYLNYQLFINDTSALNDNKGFLTTYEPSLHNFRLHGDVTFLIQDLLSIAGGVTINAYSGMKLNAKAWNTLPVECNVHASWNAMKKLVLKSDFYFFGGGYYLDKGNVARAFHSAADLSFGGDYAITERFGAFINLNNIFGKNYERWHNYPVYGINVIGGLSCRF
jgi:outer membrane receptor protein involved in Fe transport